LKRFWDSSGGQIGDRRLLADDGFQLGNDLHHHLRIGAERLQQILAPVAQDGLVRREDLPEQLGERPDERAVGHAALELVELAGGEIAALLDDGLLHLVHQR